MIDRRKQNRQLSPFWIVALFVGVGGGFQMVGINADLWIDEAYSAIVSRQSVSGILEALRNDNGPPVYYLLLKAWTGLFGVSPAGIRSLSVFLYLLTIPLMYLLGKEAAGKNAGLLSAGLFTVSSFALNLGQQARMYPLLAFWAAVTLWMFYRQYVRNTSRPSEIYLFPLVLWGGLLVHYWAIFYITALWLLLLPGGKRDAIMRFTLQSGAAGTLFAVSWLNIFLTQLGNGSTSWIPPVGVFRGLLETLSNFFEVTSEKQGLAVYALIFSTVAFGFIRQRGKLSQIFYEFKKRENLLPLLLTFLTLLIPLLISQFKPIYRTNKYPIVVLPAFLLFLGILLERARLKALSGVLLAVIGLFSITFLTLERRNPENYVQSQLFREMAQKIEKKDALIACGLSYATVKYYFDVYYGLGNMIIAYPAEIARHPGWRNVADFKKRIPDLRREAEMSVRKLSKNESSGKVWLFTGFSQDQAVSSIMEKQLLEDYEVRNKIYVRGSFFTEIWELVYRKKSPVL